MAKSKSMKGYLLTDEQKKTIGNVTKLLVQAECYLEAEDVDNSMECYGDFVALYKQITMSLNKSYSIMRIHNTTEQAYYIAKTEAGSLYGKAVDSESTNLHGGYTHL